MDSDTKTVAFTGACICLHNWSCRRWEILERLNPTLSKFPSLRNKFGMDLRWKVCLGCFSGPYVQLA